MSSLYLAVELNNEIKNQLVQKQLILKQNSTGEFEDPTRFHITVRFLAKEQFNCNTAMEALKLFGQIYTPKKFTVIANSFNQFEQGVGWIGMDKIMPLYELKYQIEDCLKKCNFPLQKDTHDSYTPHITMAYNFSATNLSTINFGEPIPIEVDNLSLWAGFKANDTYVHNKLFGVDFK